jgi:hypothetical protein
MFRILCTFVLIVGVVSFTSTTTSTQPWGRVKSFSKSKPTTTTTSLFMFNINDDKQAPAAVALQTITAIETEEDDEKSEVRNVVRDMNTGEIKEVKWVDPAMRANTRPWEMSWWAYLAFGFPFIVLANDFLHFLPTDGPIGFLGRM